MKKIKQIKMMCFVVIFISYYLFNHHILVLVNNIWLYCILFMKMSELIDDRLTCFYHIYINNNRDHFKN